METFSTRQSAIIAASNKTVYWLFRVTDIQGNIYFWSTSTVPSSGYENILHNIVEAPGNFEGNEWDRPHDFMILSFSGISLRRGKSESGIHAPSDVSFSIINRDNELDADTFIGGTVRICLVIDDGNGREVCGAWRFRIKGASPYNRQIDIDAEDFLQQYLKGTYPNTKLVDEINPSIYGTAQDTLCVPEPYGTCYIPLRSIYDSSDRYYVLGPSGYTYTISEVRSPRELGTKITWSSGSYSFTQSNTLDGNWRVFQPLIAGTGPYYPGVWVSGSRLLDMPTRFSRSDTRGNLVTNLFLYSEQLSNAAWINYGVTVTANATTSPDGTLTAERVSPNGGMSSFVTQAFTGVIGTKYTCSVYAKANVGELLYFEWHPDSWSEVVGSVFNLTTGTIVEGLPGDKIDPVGNGWYRCSGTRTAVATSISNAFFIDQYPNGDAGDSIFLWGAQVEEGETVHSYIPTTSSVASEYLINPADVIRLVLRNMGVHDYDLNLASFDEAKETFNSWSLKWNFAFYYRQERVEVLSTLLAMCGSCLVIGEQIKLQVLSKTSKMTITATEVIKNQEVGLDTFRYTATLQDSASDSGYVAYQIAGESQDEFLTALVPAKTTTDVKDAETIVFAGVQNTQHVQKLGTLYYQRKFLKIGDINYSGKGTTLALRPDDVITINGANYGGSYPVLIDEMTIVPDASVQFKCIKFRENLDDWADLNPGAITVGTDTVPNTFSPVISGPDGTSSSGTPPNVLPGRLRVGDGSSFIVLDPAPPIKVGVYAASVEQLRIGNLSGFVGVITNTYGLGIGNAPPGFRAKITATEAYIGSDTHYMQYLGGVLTIRGTLNASDITVGSLDGSMISSGTITAAQIASGTITATQISGTYVYTGTLSAAQVNAVAISASSITTGTLAAARIAAGSLNASVIAAGTITATQIAAGTITATQISSSYVYTGTLVADNITTGILNCALLTIQNLSASSISTGTLSTSRIADYSLTGIKLANGTITGTQISGAYVYTGTLTASQVNAVAIDAGSITTGTLSAYRIAARSLNASVIAAGTITAYEISSSYVYAGTIAAGNISAGTLSVGVVLDATQIVSGTIAATRIAASSISAGIIDASKITTGTFGASTVYAGAISAGQITSGSISSSRITSTSIATGVIDASKITTGTLGANVVYAGTISANNITSGTLQAGVVYAGTINADNITSGTLSVNRISANSINGYHIATGGYGIATLNIVDRAVTNVASVFSSGTSQVTATYPSWQTATWTTITTNTANTYLFALCTGQYHLPVGYANSVFVRVVVDGTQVGWFGWGGETATMDSWPCWTYFAGYNLVSAGTHYVYLDVCRYTTACYPYVNECTMSLLGAKR